MKYLISILTFSILLFCHLAEAQQIIHMDNPVSTRDYTSTINCHLSTMGCRGAKDQKTKIVLGPGQWRIDGTIYLTLGDQLYLDFGAELIRKDCSQNGPMIYLSGRYSSVIGSDMNLIMSECSNLTNGLIMVGHQSAHSKGNIISCRIQNLTITGNNHAYPGNKTTGIYAFNNQNETGITSLNVNYFHTITDVIFSYLDTGIHLYNSNACTISNILFNRVGANGGQGLLLEGAQETKVNNVHHGHSPGVHSIEFRSSERTFDLAYNAISNYIVEIGKVSNTQGKGHNSRDEDLGYCLHFDVDANRFFDNDINVICNHTYFVKMRKGITYQKFKQKALRTSIRE